MVYYFTSQHESITYTIYMGKDKFENEQLIQHGYHRDIWFHVDDLSSAHVYLRLHSDTAWTVDNIPKPLLIDCCQLTKHNSIDGSKLNNVRIVYTQWGNLKKTGDMMVGQIGFHSENKRKFFLVDEKVNAIINRLNKTRGEVSMDVHVEKKQVLEGEERAAEKEAKRKQSENEKKQKAEYARIKAESSYDRMFTKDNMVSNAELAYKNNTNDGGDDNNNDDFM